MTVPQSTGRIWGNLTIYLQFRVTQVFNKCASQAAGGQAVLGKPEGSSP